LSTRARAVALACAALLAACSSAIGQVAAQPGQAPAEGAALRVEGAWVRATVEGQAGTGAYLRITSPTGARLVGAQSPIARAVEFHSMRAADGRMAMRRLDAVVLPAGRTVAFDTHGLHVMLIGLAHALRPGDRVPIRLDLIGDSGARQSVELLAPVLPIDH
jgi:copper(I)-binding protein